MRLLPCYIEAVKTADFENYLRLFSALRILCERQDPADLAKLSEILDSVRKALDLDITDFASALFLYRRTIVTLTGNCISPLVMNAFFQSSITTWTDCCEYIGRERLLEILSETNDCICQGNADRAVELFAGCIEQFKAHLNDAY